MQQAPEYWKELISDYIKNDDGARYNTPYPFNIIGALSTCCTVSKTNYEAAMTRLPTNKQWLLRVWFDQAHRMSIDEIRQNQPNVMPYIIKQRVTVAMIDLLTALVKPAELPANPSMTYTRALTLPYPQNIWLYIYNTVDATFRANENLIKLYLNQQPQPDTLPTDYNVVQSFKQHTPDMAYDVKGFAKRFKAFIEIYNTKDTEAATNTAETSTTQLGTTIKEVCPVESFTPADVVKRVIDHRIGYILAHLEKGKADMSEIFTDEIMPSVLQRMHDMNYTKFVHTDEPVLPKATKMANIASILQTQCDDEEIKMLLAALKKD